MKSTQLKQAEIAYKQRDYKKAAEICRAIVAAHPRQYSALIVLANALTMQRHLDEAEASCQKILDLAPEHPKALNLLAVIYLARDQDRHSAIDFLQRAIITKSDDWEALANLGQLYIEEGMLAEGADMLRRSLSINPKNFSVHNGLGMYEKERGRPNVAAQHFQHALKINPANTAVRNNLASCGAQAMLQIEPGEGHKSPEYMAAYQLAAIGDYANAARQFQALLQSDPDNRNILASLAKTCIAQGKSPEAHSISEKLIKLAPDWAEAHNIRGFLLTSAGANINEITAHFKKAAELASDDWHALINLGNLAIDQESLEDADRYFKRALNISPGNLKALHGLGLINTMRRDFSSAADLYRQMFDATPDNPAAAANLISCLSKAERWDEALDACNRYMEIADQDVTVFSVYSFSRHGCLWEIARKLLPKIREQMARADISLAMYFIGANLGLMSEPDFSNEDLLEFHKRIGAQTSITTKPPFAVHPKAITKRKRLRIGYLSADFSAHSVSFFFNNIFKQHDTARFEIYLYSNTPLAKEDSITAMYRREAEKFLCIFGMTDAQVAERIENDGINILIDLGGYTDRSRVSVLAYRPAPVQISYLGYPATTGIPAVDYVLADPYLNGPENQNFFIEKVFELPESFLCFGHLRLSEIAATMPWDHNGHVTFGSLTNPYKLNARTLDVWAEVLRAIPDSRLYLNHPRFDWRSAQERVVQAFVERGIDPERLTIESRRHPSGSHLGLYANMDMSLDTMPLTGGTTTVDALSMGIPVVTRVGDVFHQRISYSIIMNTGVDAEALVAFDDREFIKKAIALASEPERIRHYRTAIPVALRNSILCDMERFVRQLEDAYLTAWTERCAESPLADFLSPDADTGAEKRQHGLLTISTRSSYHDLFHYVLQEQGEWYDKEVRFAATMADFFTCVWDIAEDPGIYALPIAIAQLPSGGVTHAIRHDPELRRLLERSIGANNLTNATVAAAVDNASKPDLVRLGFMDESDSMAWLERHWEHLKASPPVILLQPTAGFSGISPEALEVMDKHGMSAFRLLPGIGALVPLEPDFNPDTPLLFCKGEKRKRLTTAGLICETNPILEKMAPATSTDWFEVIKLHPGLIGKLVDWAHFGKQHSEFGDLYMMALNNLNGCFQHSTSILQRVRLLKFVKGILISVVNAEPTVPRILTLIRVLVDSGEKASAVLMAVSLAEQLEKCSGRVLDEPFVHPLPGWRRLSPASDEAQWAFSLCLATAERLRRPTTFFSPEESRPIWQKLSEYPWFANEASRVLHLIDARTGG